MKIEATELRIGNLVFFNKKEHTLRCEDFYYMKKDGIYEAIPLTEQRLENFGFENYKEGYFSYNGFDVATKHASDAYELLKYISNDFYPIQWVQYAHKLQNSYFALTNEELIYNNATQTLPDPS